MPDYLPEDKIKSKIIIGTRGSELALWKANYVKDLLAGIGLDSELKIIKTQGDKILNLASISLKVKDFSQKNLKKNFSTVRLIWLSIPIKIFLPIIPKA